MKTAIVAGGNRGIGYAVCEALADKGYRVVAVARDAAASVPQGVEVVQGDLASRRTADALASSSRTYFDSKRANVLMMPLFAERWKDTGVTVDAVHPGVIRTGLGDRRGAQGTMLPVAKRPWPGPAAGAAPVVRLVTDHHGHGTAVPQGLTLFRDPPASNTSLAVSPCIARIHAVHSARAWICTCRKEECVYDFRTRYIFRRRRCSLSRFGRRGSGVQPAA
ncbi:SDR family NAD(P)-dependent oxidoreductase [Streptomyces sp. NPDC058614]|uniref:SDR family NAD(P)-dependent oxidoreductase n=1 Tax=Streptomyces sp. NPDC058614 TaxID=3346557 RepID=UPI00365D4C23